MQINFYTKDDVVVLEPAGKLMVGQGVRELNERLDALLEEGQKEVIVDLGKTAWISSPGVSTLLDHHSKFKEIGGHLKLTNLTEEVRKIVGITRLASVFEIYDTLQAALGSFKG